MLSSRSYAGDRLHYSSEDEDQLDDDRDRGCYVVWKTTSVLESYPALLPPPALRRSGAPEPSLAIGTTPKTKRTTTNAALPSPSSVAVDESGSAEGSLGASTSSSSSRQAKKRRSISSRRAAVAARQAMATGAAEPLDARTLEMVTQLSRKIQARTAAAAVITTPRQTSAAGSRTAVPSGSGGTRSASGNRNVGKNGAAARSGTARAQPRSPLRQSMLSTNATATPGSTPLRQTPARIARQQQQTLSLSATKATLFATSKAGSSSRNKTFDAAAAVPEAKVMSPEVLVPPTPTYGSTTLASIANGDRGDVVQPFRSTAAIENDEDYFEGDASFELALSQVDEKSLVPSQSAAAARTLPKTGSAPARRPFVVPEVASHTGPLVAAARKDSMPTVTAARSVRAPSPRVKGPSIGIAQAAQPSVKPLGSAGPSTGAAGSAPVLSGPLAAPTSRPLPAAARPAANSLPSRQTAQPAAPPAAAIAATNTLRSNLTSGPAPPKTAATFVVRTSGSSRLKTSATAGKDRLAMEELARKEIEALEMMGEEEGSMLWDDDDF